MCNYKTKSKSGLKTHKTRIHKSNQKKCLKCDFEAPLNDQLEEHMKRVHSKDDEARKRPAPSYNCDVPDCGSIFDSNEKLLEHEQNQHVKSDQTFSINEKSPTASPSRKKTVD